MNVKVVLLIVVVYKSKEGFGEGDKFVGEKSFESVWEPKQSDNSYNYKDDPHTTNVVVPQNQKVDIANRALINLISQKHRTFSEDEEVKLINDDGSDSLEEQHLNQQYMDQHRQVPLETNEDARLNQQPIFPNLLMTKSTKTPSQVIPSLGINENDLINTFLSQLKQQNILKELSHMIKNNLSQQSSHALTHNIIRNGEGVTTYGKQEGQYSPLAYHEPFGKMSKQQTLLKISSTSQPLQIINQNTGLNNWETLLQQLQFPHRHLQAKQKHKNIKSNQKKILPVISYITSTQPPSQIKPLQIHNNTKNDKYLQMSQQKLSSAQLSLLSKPPQSDNYKDVTNIRTKESEEDRYSQLNRQKWLKDTSLKLQSTQIPTKDNLLYNPNQNNITDTSFTELEQSKYSQLNKQQSQSSPQHTSNQDKTANNILIPPKQDKDLKFNQQKQLEDLLQNQQNGFKGLSRWQPFQLPSYLNLSHILSQTGIANELFKLMKQNEYSQFNPQQVNEDISELLSTQSTQLVTQPHLLNKNGFIKSLSENLKQNNFSKLIERLLNLLISKLHLNVENDVSKKGTIHKEQNKNSQFSQQQFDEEPSTLQSQFSQNKLNKSGSINRWVEQSTQDTYNSQINQEQMLDKVLNSQSTLSQKTLNENKIMNPLLRPVEQNKYSPTNEQQRLEKLSMSQSTQLPQYFKLPQILNQNTFLNSWLKSLEENNTMQSDTQLDKDQSKLSETQMLPQSKYFQLGQHQQDPKFQTLQSEEILLHDKPAQMINQNDFISGLLIPSASKNNNLQLNHQQLLQKSINRQLHESPQVILQPLPYQNIIRDNLLDSLIQNKFNRLGQRKATIQTPSKFILNRDDIRNSWLRSFNKNIRPYAGQKWQLHGLLKHQYQLSPQIITFNKEVTDLFWQPHNRKIPTTTMGQRSQLLHINTPYYKNYDPTVRVNADNTYSDLLNCLEKNDHSYSIKRKVSKEILNDNENNLITEETLEGNKHSETSHKTLVNLWNLLPLLQMTPRNSLISDSHELSSINFGEQNSDLPLHQLWGKNELVTQANVEEKMDDHDIGWLWDQQQKQLFRNFPELLTPSHRSNKLNGEISWLQFYGESNPLQENQQQYQTHSKL